jgi:protein sex-lethal
MASSFDPDAGAGGDGDYAGHCSNDSFNSGSGSDEVARKKTSLIVNYLPQTFLDNDLVELFSPYGQLENVRVMRDRKTGYSFGYGFVNYVKEEDAAEAIQNLNGLRVADNKTIRVTLARPPSENIKDTNLYITNLPRDITEDELVNLFSPYGTIVQKNLLYDKYTGLSRGVGFVRYDKREEASAAIDAMNNFTPPNALESIRVKLAENHGKQKAAYVLGFQTGYHQQSQHREPRYYNQNSHSSDHSKSSHYDE